MSVSRRIAMSCALLSPAFAAACDAMGEPDTPVAVVDAPLRTSVVPEKELFVTDLSVVNDAKHEQYAPGKWNTDPNGSWSFGRLIDNLTGLAHPTDRQRSDFVLHWLRTFETDQVVNGQLLAARPLVRDLVITPWKLASIGRVPGATEATCSADPASDATCSLSFDRDVAPFDLIAIVNRTDLRVVPDGTRGGHASAGQGRFVFTLVDQASRAPLPLTVIFEYMVPAHTLADIQTYAKGWHDIGGAAWGRALNDKVHAQTVKFTAQNIARWRQNGSALLQLRTNDVILAPPGSDPSHPFGVMWQLREWVLGSDGQLTPDAVKQEPRIDLSGSALLTQWVNANANGILLNSYEVPYSFGGQSFMAASSIVPFDFVWDVPGVAENVRDAFALGTCNGCHRNETGTLFLHVFPTAAGVEATKSDWLAAQYASQSAPRVADLIEVLDKDFAKLKSGKGKDKGHSPDD